MKKRKNNIKIKINKIYGTYNDEKTRWTNNDY